MHPRRTHPDAARRLALIAAGAAPPEPAADADTGANRPAQPAEPAEAWWADHTRIALPAAPAVPAVPVDPVAPAGRVALSAPSAPSAPRAPALPVPGRHAARRRLLPSLDRLRDAAPSLGPAHVAVVALVVALGLAGTAWWVVRAEAGPSVVPVAGEGAPALVTDSTAAALAGAPSAATPTTGAAPSAPSTPSAGPASGAPVTVDVAGKVRRPGIVVLPPGTRVVDALRAAGGARPGVDTTALNLARVLVDGEQIVVGGPAPPAGGSAAAAAPPGAGPAPVGPLVNLNQAGQAELETLPQVGPVTAQAIIAWREQRGGFTSVDELLEVDGIGEKTLARLAPHVTV